MLTYTLAPLGFQKEDSSTCCLQTVDLSENYCFLGSTHTKGAVLCYQIRVNRFGGYLRRGGTLTVKQPPDQKVPMLPSDVPTWTAKKSRGKIVARTCCAEERVGGRSFIRYVLEWHI